MKAMEGTEFTGRRLSCLLVALLLAAALPSLAKMDQTERTGKPTAQPVPSASDATSTKSNEDTTFKGMKYRVVGPFRGGRSLTASGISGDPTTYYFGATGGGVWKSTDGAMTWSPVFDKEGTGAIGSLAVAPSDPNVI